MNIASVKTQEQNNPKLNLKPFILCWKAISHSEIDERTGDEC
jgi:hypothetical protein